jgi:hypothetical protein
MTLKNLILPFLGLLLIGTAVSPSSAQVSIDIDVKTVLASNDTSYGDPQIPELTQKLKSVFRYSSYRLLSRNRLVLKTNETGEVSLPGKREMKIRPVRILGDRAELELLILKKKRQVIQSRVQIINRGSIVLGGPQYKGGYLLFEIFISF